MPDGASPIIWRIHLSASPEEVYQLLSTDDGRAHFWAESARETDGEIQFQFPNGETWSARILEERFPYRYGVEYIGGSMVMFELESDGAGGTDLTLTDEGVVEDQRAAVSAGWVSVLMSLKAAADFGVDLRNHDAARTWDQGYIDN